MIRDGYQLPIMGESKRYSSSEDYTATMATAITREMLDAFRNNMEKYLFGLGNSLKEYKKIIEARSTSEIVGHPELGIHGEYYNKDRLDELYDGEEAIEELFADKKLSSLEPDDEDPFQKYGRITSLVSNRDMTMDITKCFPHTLYEDALRPLHEKEGLAFPWKRRDELSKLRPDDDTVITTGNMRMKIIKSRPSPLY